MENNATTLEVIIKEQMQQALTSIDKLGNKIDGLANKFDKAATSSGKIGKSLANMANLGGAIATFKVLFKQMQRVEEKAQDYTEQLNLFNVVFRNTEKNGVQMYSKIGKEATIFQNKLKENFGAYKTQTMRYQALFQSMGESSGIDQEVALTMSKAMTKMSYDLASLFNREEGDVAEALKAGVYAGQTKPMRNFGIDITQTSMKPIADELGLEKSISQMSQAEKQMLRYIAVLRQGKIAMGDFANTIESPANQLKVLRQQVQELGVAIGSLFMGMFQKILPYINAVLMVLKEIIKTIASIFGIKLKDYNTGIATSADYFEDVGDAAGGATKKAKALKKEIMSFDQIHNIDTPTSSGGSGGGGAGGIGSIDPKLLNAIKDYENGMENVRMKAVEIRDAIMEWLGYTKHVDDETGEVYFTLDKGFTKIKLIGGLLAGATILGAITKIKKIVDGLGLVSLFSKISPYLSVIGTGIGEIFAGTSTFGDLIGALSPKLAGFIGGLGGAGEAAAGAGTAAGAAAAPILAIAAAIAAVAGVSIHAYKHNEDFRNSVNDMFKELKKTADELYELLKPVIKVLGEVVKVMIEFGKAAVIGAIKNCYEIIKTMVQLKIEAFTTKLKVVKDLLKGDFKAAFNDAKEGIEKMTKTVVKCAEKIKDNYVEAWERITGVKEIKDKFRNIEDVFKAAGENIAKVQLVPDTVIDDKYVENTKNNLKKLTDIIQTNIKEAKNEMTTGLNDLVSKGFLTPEEMEESLGKLDEYYDGIDTKVSEAEANINRIMEEAKNNNGKISDEQRKELTKNWEIIQEGTAKSLTTSKQEQAIIMKQIKQTNGDISKETASELIKNAIKVKDEAIKAAETQYTDTLREAQKMYDIGAISEEQYNKICDDAKTTKDNAIRDAQEQYNGVYDEFASMNKDIAGYIDRDDGHVKSKWEKWLDDFKTNASTKWETFKEGLGNWAIGFWNKIKEGVSWVWTQLKNWWNEHVAKYFTKEYWTGEVEKAVSGIQNIKLKTPHIKWEKGPEATGWIAKALNAIGLDARLPKLKIDWYANGGFPTMGEMFIAREAGPELVGKIGNKTAVLNNTQIVNSVADGVARAVAGVMGKNGAGAIQVVVHTDEGVVVDRINRITETTGTCPINI